MRERNPSHPDQHPSGRSCSRRARACRVRRPVPGGSGEGSPQAAEIQPNAGEPNLSPPNPNTPLGGTGFCPPGEVSTSAARVLASKATDTGIPFHLTEGGRGRGGGARGARGGGGGHGVGAAGGAGGVRAGGGGAVRGGAGAGAGGRAGRRAGGWRGGEVSAPTGAGCSMVPSGAVGGGAGGCGAALRRAHLECTARKAPDRDVR